MRDLTSSRCSKALYMRASTNSMREMGPSSSRVETSTHNDPAEVQHACMDMSAACAKGAVQVVSGAPIRYHRFHVVMMANKAMDQVGRQEVAQDVPRVRSALRTGDRKTRSGLHWGCGATWTAGHRARPRLRCTGCSAPRRSVRARGG